MFLEEVSPVYNGSGVAAGVKSAMCVVIQAGCLWISQEFQVLCGIPEV